MKLENKVAIITGSGGGIGRAVALRYAREGAKCVITDIQGELAESTAKEIRNIGGSGFHIQMDVRLQVDIEHVINTTLESLNWRIHDFLQLLGHNDQMMFFLKQCRLQL